MGRVVLGYYKLTKHMIAKFLYQPVKPYIVTQKFGEKGACVDLATDKKVVNSISGVCPNGYKSLYPPGGHNGIDVRAKRGQPLYAATDGFVFAIQPDPKLGVEVSVITDAKYYFKETQTFAHAKYRYCHLLSPNEHLKSLVKDGVGTPVKTGDLIGWADNTGYSNGDHLHWDLKPVAKDSHGFWYNLLNTNGFYGAVDIAPYLEDKYALDIKAVNSKLAYLQEQLAVLIELVAVYLRKQRSISNSPK